MMKIKIPYDIAAPIQRAIEVPNGTPFSIEFDFKRKGQPWQIPFAGTGFYNVIPVKANYIADYEVDGNGLIWHNAPAIDSPSREDFYTVPQVEGTKLTLICEGQNAGRKDVKLFVNTTNENLTGIVSDEPVSREGAEGLAWPTKMLEVRLFIDFQEGYEFPSTGGGGEGTVKSVNSIEPDEQGNVNVGKMSYTTPGGQTVEFAAADIGKYFFQTAAGQAHTHDQPAPQNQAVTMASLPAVLEGNILTLQDTTGTPIGTYNPTTFSTITIDKIPTQTAVLNGTYTDDTEFQFEVYVKNA